MRSLSESIGLTRRDAATILQVSESSVARWWSGQVRIPIGVADAVQEWVQDSEALIEEIATQLQTTGWVETYPSDEGLSGRYGALFHRVAAGRALARHRRRRRRRVRLEWAETADG